MILSAGFVPASRETGVTDDDEMQDFGLDVVPMYGEVPERCSR